MGTIEIHEQHENALERTSFGSTLRETVARKLGVVALAAGLAVTQSAGSAELPAPKPNQGAAVRDDGLDNEGATAERISVGSHEFAGTDPTTGLERVYRTIGVERSGNQAAQNEYMIEPSFALRERPQPYGFLPSIVLERDTRMVGGERLTILRLQAVLQDDSASALGKKLVEKFDAAYSKKGGEVPVIFNCPIIKAEVIARNRLSGEIYARGATNSIRNAKHADVTLTFTDASLASFVKAHNDNQLELVWSYRYRGKKGDTAQLHSILSQDLLTRAVSGLTSEQAAGLAPLTQAERVNVERNLKLAVMRDLQVTSPDLIPALLNMMTPAAFTQQLFVHEQEVETRTLSPEQQRMLAEYLKPAKKVSSDRKSESDIKRDTQEHIDSTTESGSVGVAVPVGPVAVGASGGVSHTEQDIDRKEHEQGTTKGQATTLEEKLPHKVTVSYLNVGALQTTVEESIRITIQREQNLFTAPGIPSTFTEAIARKSIDAEIAKPDLDAEIKTLRERNKALTDELGSAKKSLGEEKERADGLQAKVGGLNARVNELINDVAKWQERAKHRPGDY